MTPILEDDSLLTAGEVAVMLRVTVGTVRLWARTGKLTPASLPGCHLRFRESKIRALLKVPAEQKNAA